MQTDGNACPLVMEGATVLYFRLMPPRDREPLPDKTKQIQSTLEQGIFAAGRNSDKACGTTGVRVRQVILQSKRSRPWLDERSRNEGEAGADG